MNIQELHSELKALDISARLYSIGKRKDEAISIEQSGSKWVVVFSERGKERVLFSSESEAEACEAMLREIKHDL